MPVPITSTVSCQKPTAMLHCSFEKRPTRVPVVAPGVPREDSSVEPHRTCSIVHSTAGRFSGWSKSSSSPSWKTVSRLKVVSIPTLCRPLTGIQPVV